MPRLDFFPDLAFGWVFYAVLMAFLTASTIVDFRTLKIPKAITVPCFLTGIAFNISRGTWLGIQDKVVWKLGAGPFLGACDGFLFSAAGFVVAFAIFFVLWFLQTAKGGDVKLFAAVGVWVGPWYIVLLMIGSVIMVVLSHMVMIMTSMVTAGFSQTHKSFSGQGSKKAIENGRRTRRRGPTYSFSLAFATAFILLVVLSRDLGLAELSIDSVTLPPISQAQ